MKKILFLILALFIRPILHAQEIQDFGKIPLAISMPEKIADLDAACMSKLEIKLAQIVTTSGLASAGYMPQFCIVPRVTINETNVAEAGMQNITVVTAEVSLFINQMGNDVLISSMSKQLKGSGVSKNAAIANAIAQISPSDPEYKMFIQTSKNKIVSYYEGECEDLMTNAENLVIKKDYQGAMTILMSVPIEAKECYKKAQWKLKYVYTAYENQICNGLINNVKIKIAGMEYSNALSMLAEVDPASSCGKEAGELLKETQKKVAAEQKKEWDLAIKIYNDENTLEKHRIDAIKEIVIAQYKKQSGRKHHKSEED